MGTTDKLVSRNWEDWEEPRRPMVATPLLVAVAGGVGWFGLSNADVGAFGVAFGSLFVAMVATLVGQVVLARFDG